MTLSNALVSCLIAMALSVSAYFSPPVAAQEVVTCSAFDSQADAQAELRRRAENGATDGNLDFDRDGIACNDFAGFRDPARDESLALPALPAEYDAMAMTFQLTIRGEAKAGDAFSLRYQGTQDRNVGGGVEFCGFPPNAPSTSVGEIDDVARLPCDGNGTIYTRREAVPAGVPISFTFYRSSEQAGGDPETRSRTLRPNGDHPVKLVLSYPPLNLEVRRLPDLPNSGGGGAAAHRSKRKASA